MVVVGWMLGWTGLLIGFAGRPMLRSPLLRHRVRVRVRAGTPPYQLRSISISTCYVKQIADNLQTRWCVEAAQAGGVFGRLLLSPSSLH
jgi:hypothetical protein